jgi:hypothetical protein
MSKFQLDEYEIASRLVNIDLKDTLETFTPTTDCSYNWTEVLLMSPHVFRQMITPHELFVTF